LYLAGNDERWAFPPKRATFPPKQAFPPTALYVDLVGMMVINAAVCREIKGSSVNR
jgi:hypothetical protein